MASRSHPSLAVQSEHVQRGLNSLRRPRVHTPPVLAFRHLSSTPDFATGYAFQGALILNYLSASVYRGCVQHTLLHLSFKLCNWLRVSRGTNSYLSASVYRDCLTHIPSIAFRHLSFKLCNWLRDSTSRLSYTHSEHRFPAPFLQTLTGYTIEGTFLISGYVLHTLRAKLQALVYDILPSTTAVFSYDIGSRKLSANEQFFVGAQTVVSLLQTTQMKQGVSFIAANKVYTSTNKTAIV